VSSFYGILGAIVITTIASQTLPLARYRIGDVGSIDHSPCDCLLNGCPNFVLHGRAKDRLFPQGWQSTEYRSGSVL
jgi:phenylacetate-coenzyme A ligase PaaK-like adenylate-forming protein